MTMKRPWREENRARGICTSTRRCRKPTGGATLCAEHALKASAATSKTRLKKLSQGECVQCHEACVPGQTRCEVHAREHRLDYPAAVAAGRCPSCGDERDGPQHHCTKCRVKQTTARKAAVVRGTCPNHKDEPPRPGKQYCWRCCWLMWESALKKYDLTLEDYAWMEYHQGRFCKACRLPSEEEDGLQVDHIHGTKIVRGLLCGPCNRTVGHAEESIPRLQAIIAYLTQEC